LDSLFRIQEVKLLEARPVGIEDVENGALQADQFWGWKEKFGF
jgi:hypothetical protein